MRLLQTQNNGLETNIKRMILIYYSKLLCFYKTYIKWQVGHVNKLKNKASTAMTHGQKYIQTFFQSHTKSVDKEF